VREVEDDPGYRHEVAPLFTTLWPRTSGTVLDLGCGEGRLMRDVARAGFTVVGVDATRDLLAVAAGAGPVVEARLPGLDWVRAASVDGAFAVLVLEHLADVATFFEATAAAVRPGGALVVVMNHPAYTAPGAGPVVDPTDGEVYWRWGPYFEEGAGDEPAGEGSITFHHRPLGMLLSRAAAAGWRLEEMMERPATGDVLDSLVGDQGQIPRLLGVRWRR
jgi:SAM-dependent methyltransferase